MLKRIFHYLKLILQNVLFLVYNIYPRNVKELIVFLNKFISVLISLKIAFLLFCLFVCLFPDKVSLCSPGYPGNHSVDQAGLELRNLPASAPKCWD